MLNNKYDEVTSDVELNKCRDTAKNVKEKERCSRFLQRSGSVTDTKQKTDTKRSRTIYLVCLFVCLFVSLVMRFTSNLFETRERVTNQDDIHQLLISFIQLPWQKGGV